MFYARIEVKNSNCSNFQRWVVKINYYTSFTDNFFVCNPKMTLVNPWIQWSAMHILNLSLYSNHLHVRILKIRLTHMLHPNIRFLHILEGPYCDNKDKTKIYSYLLASSRVWPAKVETWFLFSHWSYRFFIVSFLLGRLADSICHCTLRARKYQLNELSLGPNFLFKVLTCTKPLTLS